jgi:hypothetical protein
MLSVIYAVLLKDFYAECRYAECRGAKNRALLGQISFQLLSRRVRSHQTDQGHRQEEQDLEVLHRDGLLQHQVSMPYNFLIRRPK